MNGKLIFVVVAEDNSFFAELTFNGYFTTDTGAIIIDVDDEGLSPQIQAHLNDCVTYLAFVSLKDDFEVNGETFDATV